MRRSSPSRRSTPRRKAPAAAPPLTQLSDEALVAVVLQRSDAAWRELLRRFRPLLYHCMHKTAWRQGIWLGVDERGEVFGELACALLRGDMYKLRVWRPGRCKLGTWLGLLASHATSDHLRRRRRQPIHVSLEGALEHAPEREADEPSALDELLDREETTLDRRRWRCLLSLASGCSDVERRFLELFFAERLPPAEVAERMGISIRTVHSRASKLRRKLAQLVRADPRALRLCEPGGPGRGTYRLAG